MSMIRTEHLAKSFGELVVLKDINLTVESGEVVVIIGPSGAGKSTFLRSLNNLEKITSGKIFIEDKLFYHRENDRTVDKMEAKQHKDLLLEMGMVFQRFNLFPHKTVLENVMLAPMHVKKVSREKAEKTAKDLIAKVGLADKLDEYPARLSGGQQQRVAIARALVNNPKIILADEPTGALDSRSGIQVMNLFQQLNEEGVTIIMITHDANIANHAKKVLHIFDGEIVEDKARKEKEKQQSEVQSEAAESVSSELEKDFGVNAWEGEI